MSNIIYELKLAFTLRDLLRKKNKTNLASLLLNLSSFWETYLI